MDAAAQYLQQLRAEWPHREQQIEALAALLRQRAAPDILVHGPPSTGKTGVARAVAALRPHAYVRCTRSTRLRGALAAILWQLQAAGAGGAIGSTGAGAGKRKRAAGYAAPTGSEATLIAELQALCGSDPLPPPPAPPGATPEAAADAAAAASPSQRDAQRRQGDQNSSSQQQQQRLEQQRQQQRIVVLDDVHHLLAADDAAARPGDGAPVLRGLLRLREQAGLRLAFVLVSGADAGASGALACLAQCCALQVIAFPQYTQAQLRDVLCRLAPAGVNRALYARFLDSLLLASTAKVSLCLPDLRTAAAQLWPAYVAPLLKSSGAGGDADGGDGSGAGSAAAAAAAMAAAAEDDAALARLFQAAGPRAAALARAFEPAASAAGVAGGPGGLAALQGVGGVAELELTAMSKYLLVAGERVLDFSARLCCWCWNGAVRR